MTREEKGKEGEKTTSRMRIDPRFMRIAKKDTKVVIDERFQSMFTEDEFVAPVKVDKYGRRIVSDREISDLKSFYRLEGEDEGGQEKSAQSESAYPTDRTASEYSSSEEEDEGDEGGATFVLDEALSSHPLVADGTAMGEATRRLALVNLDWDQIRAEDIYALAHGFKPATGMILSVTIYPSKFGRERMARELEEGPPTEIFTKADKQPGEEEKDDHYESDEEKDGYQNDDGMLMLEEEETANENALRQYQMERLRYYYAVIECDTPETAWHIYRNCDGSEFEKSANFIDARFIPDSVTFTEEVDGKPWQICTVLPEKYRPKHDMATAALQKSQVSLTWDADDTERSRITRAAPGRIDWGEEDLRAYLASSSGEEEHEDAAIDANHYRQLLMGTENVFARKNRDCERELEITFTSAIDTAQKDPHLEGPDLKQEESNTSDEEGQDLPTDSTKSLSQFEKYLLRRKEKRRARKKMIKEVKMKTALDGKSKRKSHTKEVSSNLQEQRQLDLLVMDEQQRDPSDDEGDYKGASGGRKGKRRDRDEKDQATLDIQDPRFAAMLESPAYALDPSHPSFKRSKAAKRIIEERQRRKQEAVQQ